MLTIRVNKRSRVCAVGLVLAWATAAARLAVCLSLFGCRLLLLAQCPLARAFEAATAAAAAHTSALEACPVKRGERHCCSGLRASVAEQYARGGAPSTARFFRSQQTLFRFTDQNTDWHNGTAASRKVNATVTLLGQISFRCRWSICGRCIRVKRKYYQQLLIAASAVTCTSFDDDVMQEPWRTKQTSWLLSIELRKHQTHSPIYQPS